MAFYDEARVARGKGDLSLFPKFLAFIMAFGTFKRSYSSKPEDFLGVGLSISALAGIVYWAKNHGTTKDIKKYGKRLWSSVTYAAKVAVSGFALGRVFGGDAPGDNTSRTYLRYSEESGDLIIEEVD
ncbi:hypothetical protein HOK96_02280 [bacterium]|nr:hypothetical protein [bacterium]MBT5345850.1 hypothetical protein [bacterium]MBT6130829.1 hypothetical protein [bacterium]